MGIAEEFATENILKLSGIVNGQTKELELVLGRATLTVQANFSSWCRDVTMERCKQLAVILPDSGRRAAIERACDMIVKECDWGQPVANSLMASPIGMAKYLHLLLSDKQRAAVSVTDIADLVWSADSEEISRKLLVANGVSQEDILKVLPKAAAAPTSQSTGAVSSLISPGG